MSLKEERKEEVKRKKKRISSKKRSKKTTPKPKVSPTVKPQGMTLKDWQTMLRRLIAREEKMGVRCVDDKNLPGEYLVRNPKSRQEYKVVYRGAGSAWNYCACMDFKTSQLGTCKHLEAVKLWLSNTRNHHVQRDIPTYTSVYLSYAQERKVCIRIGTDHEEEYRQLASCYFDSEGMMLPDAFDRYTDFLLQAIDIDPAFRFYQDAIDFILEHRERNLRERIIADYSDDELDRLLTTTLYPYQKEGARFAFTAGRSIIADEMGLGKTIQAIATAELLRREKLAEQVLIVCPTSLKYQWKREIERFAQAEVHVVEGLHHKRIEQYQTPAPYKIVSYNAACNDIKMLGTLHTDLLIMDEVQRLKNWNTQISIAARKIRSHYSVILSGTPLENKLEELYSVMEFADQWCLAPYYQFRDRYIVTDDNGKVIGYRNLNEIGQRIASRLIRRTKKQVALQMPERQDKNLFVPMTRQQMEQHNELKYTVAQIIEKWNRLRFITETDRNRLLLCLSQMRMLCDSTYILDQKTRYDTKVEEVINILKNLFDGTDEKAVVFSQWERMTRIIAHELDKRNIGYAYLHGGVPSKQRKQLIDDFTDQPDCRVFLSTDAGSTGLNLQAAATVINVDLPWNPAVLEQRIARIYRLGQKRRVQVINLVSANTIEEEMLGKLRFKSAMFEGVLDNGQDSIFIGDQSKMSAMMDSLSDMMKNEEGETQKEQPIEKEDEEQPVAPEQTADTSGEEAFHIPAFEQPDDYAKPSWYQSSTHSDTTSDHDNTPADVVNQGVSFLNGLAQTLQSAKKTEQLVNTLVHTDESTGETTLRIPVADKQTVRNILGMIGKLFGQ